MFSINNGKICAKIYIKETFVIIYLWKPKKKKTKPPKTTKKTQQTPPPKTNKCDKILILWKRNYTRKKEGKMYVFSSIFIIYLSFINKRI